MGATRIIRFKKIWKCKSADIDLGKKSINFAYIEKHPAATHMLTIKSNIERKRQPYKVVGYFREICAHHRNIISHNCFWGMNTTQNGILRWIKMN